MKIDKVQLTEEGFSHITMFRNFSLYNTKTKKYLKTISDGRVTTQLWKDNKPHYINLSKLYNKYFTYEIMKVEPKHKRSLCFMGLSNYTICDDGRLWNHKLSRWLKGSVSKRDGYISVSLQTDDAERTTQMVHRLVALAFIDNLLDLPEVNHIDGDKANNISSNLEWVDAHGNHLHARINKLRKSSLSEDEVCACCVLLEHNVTARHIAEMLNVPESTIHNLRAGNFKYITKRFNLYGKK